MELLYIAIIALIVIIIVSILVSNGNSNSTYGGTLFEDPKRTAGKYGELRATSVIRSVLRDDDSLFSNVSIIYEDRPAELDCVVVNRYGVFIIEVKNYAGYIVGKENDYKWKKYKMTDAGNIYEKTVRNPIKQVNRQVYLLAKYLNYYGIRVWVKGYALLMQGNSPVNNENILRNAGEIDTAIHTRDRELLSQNTIEQIKKLLG